MIATRLLWEVGEGVAGTQTSAKANSRNQAIINTIKTPPRELSVDFQSIEGSRRDLLVNTLLLRDIVFSCSSRTAQFR